MYGVAATQKYDLDHDTPLSLRLIQVTSANQACINLDAYFFFECVGKLAFYSVSLEPCRSAYWLYMIADILYRSN